VSSTVIPILRYQDAPRAIEWLCEAFGFQARMVVEPEPGVIAHAQLVHGTGMVMLGSAEEGEFGRQVATVETVGKPTAAVYVVVADVAAHAAHARSAGAEITIEPTEEDYGGSDYTCRDFEGNLWSFGSHDPWTE
jgi:uncharacterized glyoxalase superfamily protein PhnB